MGDAHRVHVVHPQSEGQESHGDQRRNDDVVTNQARSCQNGDNCRQGSGRRQKDDVDLGVAEQPKEVLPQKRATAALRVEKRDIEGPFSFQQYRTEDQRRKTDQHHRGDNEHVPGEDRHPVEGHAGCTQPQDRHDDFDRRADSGNLHEGNAKKPDVGIDPGTVLR